MNVILIGGAKRSGKDTFASMMREKMSNVYVVHFADPMKQLVEALFGLSRDELEDLKEDESPYMRWDGENVILDRSKSDGNVKTVRLDVPRYKNAFLREIALAPFVSRACGGSECCESYAMEALEKLRELAPENIRKALQYIGTEIFKSLFWDEIWVDVAYWKIVKAYRSGYRIFLIPDFRFPEEYVGILKLGVRRVTSVRVIRPKARKENADGYVHSSETALESFKFDHTVYNDGTLEDLERKAARVARSIAQEFLEEMEEECEILRSMAKRKENA